MPPLRFSLFSRRARRSRYAGAVALAVMVLVAAACQGTKTAPPMGPMPPPTTYCAASAPDTAGEYQAAFNGVRSANAGYFVASDGGIPAPLPDGRVVWFFGDTIAGRWTPGGPVDPFYGLGSNSFVVQEQNGRCFRPIVEAIPDLGGGEWFWPTGAVVDQANNLFHVVGQHMRPVSGEFPFELVRVLVVTFTLPNLTLQQPVWLRDLPTPDKDPNYGETITVDGGFVYAYGRTRQPPCGMFCIPPDHHFVARTQVGMFPSSGWEYWSEGVLPIPDDDGWVPTAADADPMQFDDDADTVFDPSDGPLAGLPVQRNGAGFLGSALRSDVIPGDLETWHAPAPQGPWTRDMQLAFDVPNYTTQDQFAYGGRVLLAGTLPNVPNVIALWSVNHESFDAVLANPEYYLVVFASPNPNALTPP